MLESTTEEKLDNLALEAGEQKKVCCFIKIEWKTCAISQQKFLKLRKHFLEKGERGLSCKISQDDETSLLCESDL